MKTLTYLSVLVMMLFPLSCQRQTESLEMRSDPIALEDRQEYFPLNSGRTWHYRVKFIYNPLYYRKIIWEQDATDRQVEIRGLYNSSLNNNSINQTYDLILRVKGPSAQQGRLQYPESFELTLEKDTGGIFQEAKQIYFAITRFPFFTAMLVETYPPLAFNLNAPVDELEPIAVKGGYMMRPFFFANILRAPISLNNGLETLEFVGPDKDNTLRFRRTVKSDTASSKRKDLPVFTVNRPFTEEMWFKKGVGLIRLVQIVDGKKTMTWELVQN